MGVDSDTAARWRAEDKQPARITTPVWKPDWLEPMKLYTAGPMSWIPRFNYPAFMALADSLREQGYEVVSPAELDSPEMQAKCEASEYGDPAELGNDETWGDLLSRDVKLIADEVDGVVLLPGWEESKGARLEAFVARHVGKPVFYWLGGVSTTGDEALHVATCHCNLIDMIDPLQVDWPGDLLELDDAELDFVLTATDVDTLMKMERDAGAQSIWLGKGDRVEKTEQGTHIVWDANEGGFDDRLPDSVFETERAEVLRRVDEVRKTDPVTGGAKGSKLARFDLIPAGPLWLLAEHYGKGAEKYDDRNWEKGYDWSLCYAAAMRHLNLWWDGEDHDRETGSNHLTAAAWHCFALLQFTDFHPEKDDRP